MSSQMLISPIGPIFLFGDETHLHALSLLGQAATLSESSDAAERASSPALAETIAQLEAWFAGRLAHFDLPLLPLKSTRGNALRTAICDIPYANTMSYGAVARHAQSGPRAIGQACRRNPYPIIVPCHRVIGAAQTAGYYSAGDGVITKQWLIAHEQRHQQRHS